MIRLLRGLGIRSAKPAEQRMVGVRFTDNVGIERVTVVDLRMKIQWLRDRKLIPSILADVRTNGGGS